MSRTKNTCTHTRPAIVIHSTVRFSVSYPVSAVGSCPKKGALHSFFCALSSVFDNNVFPPPDKHLNLGNGAQALFFFYNPIRASGAHKLTDVLVSEFLPEVPDTFTWYISLLHSFSSQLFNVPQNKFRCLNLRNTKEIKSTCLKVREQSTLSNIKHLPYMHCAYSQDPFQTF